jgi:hypothetical protein
VQYNIVDRDAYMQDVIHNVEGSSVQHHTKTRPPTNLISSAQLGSFVWLWVWALFGGNIQ